jgi:hypothetical protein
MGKTMTDDIVERLRERGSGNGLISSDFHEAAEEIERLRDSRERLHRWLDTNEQAYARLEAQVERAEAVIEAARHHAQDQYAMELAEKISAYDSAQTAIDSNLTQQGIIRFGTIKLIAEDAVREHQDLPDRASEA